MSRLSIVEINDPNEFIEKIQIDQNDNLYLYIEDIFKPISDIYDKAIDIYEQYLPSLIFTDIQTIHESHISNQYFSDLTQLGKKVIYSPIFARYAPMPFEIHEDLIYHAFSFLQQASRVVLPWHIPSIGFTAKINNNQFERLSKDSQWVLQHVT